MIAIVKKYIEVDFRTLILHAEVRYWEDSTVNGVDDSEAGENIPCKVGDCWKPIIEIETGVITNWKKGTTAEIHYKVADCCGWELLDEKGTVQLSKEGGYVPQTLCPKESGHGDYIIMDIDEAGKIDKWKFNIKDFLTND